MAVEENRRMTEPEREFILETARAVVAEKLGPRADRHDREGSFPSDNFEDLHGAGLTALPLPKAYGGLGGGIDGDHRVLFSAVYEIARACGSTALIYGHHAYVAAWSANSVPRNRSGATLAG